ALHCINSGAKKHPISCERLDDLGFLLTFGLLTLGKEGMDVRNDTTRGDNDVLKQLVELVVVTDGDHDVTGDDTDTLLIARSVTGELKDLSSQVLQDGSEVNGGTDTDTAGELTLLQLT